jgi:hypothetical protein
VVVLVPLLTIVVPIATVVVLTTARKRGSGRGDSSDTENPASHKRNTSNFGPHGSMFLSINDYREQDTTLIYLYALGQMEEIDQLGKLKQQWVS